MARNVYSHLFFEAAGSPINESYTVPDGYVAVIRDICAIAVPNDAGATFDIGVTPSGTAIFFYQGPGQGLYVHQELRAVVNTGDTIVLTATAETTVQVRVSGYLLSV